MHLIDNCVVHFSLIFTLSLLISISFVISSSFVHAQESELDYEKILSVFSSSPQEGIDFINQYLTEQVNSQLTKLAPLKQISSGISLYVVCKECNCFKIF